LQTVSHFRPVNLFSPAHNNGHSYFPSNIQLLAILYSLPLQDAFCLTKAVVMSKHVKVFIP